MNLEGRGVKTPPGVAATGAMTPTPIGSARLEVSLGHQRGAALIVCLMLMIVATLFGMTSFRSSNAGISIVTAEVAARATLHATEAATRQAIRGFDAGAVPPTGSIAVAVDSPDPHVDVASEVELEAIVPEEGSSLRLFRLMAFQVRTSGTFEAAEGTRRIAAGVNQRVPAR